MNGIGGRTIAEAQERMSLREFQVWVKYRNKYGQLNSMMRTEWGASLVASVLANINKSKNSPPFKVSDFAPHINEVSVSLEDAMKNWH
ncbi:phage tail assembly protein T [Klebsiella michiganensis]|uniref:phage tail assembly protein T n=1 Tax=Klebsiella michiganensis TaxID=1134687 RepID=UPI001CCA4FCE|nr:phage tail protein [Klebsiella michiganensis]MBZ7459776.1 phage tail protein [Klebsiella michiganensis]MCF0025805.1 phage tail protein [Klebsiella michiganensis]MDL4447236.1 phage tail protein [Klebsiella michiganensis]MDL4489966.1 phage tail protein [Klebsiella michiganensis]MDL4658709.1 phage tail protein [Klebsiella michiganensis]